MESHKLLPNASYFAFTATPKNKTLEIFGNPDPQADGTVRHHAFHSYTMKQAIQEGFILDVLAHYTPVNSYYRLAKTVEDDPQFDTRRRRRSSDVSWRAATTRSASRPRSWLTTSTNRSWPRASSADKPGQWWLPTALSVQSNTSTPPATTCRSARAATRPWSPSPASTSWADTKVSEASMNGFPSGRIAERFREDPYRLPGLCRQVPDRV